MKRIFCLFFCITFVGMTVMTSCAADVQLTLKPEQELNRIDGKVYSQFLEHIYHSVNGGLWGELVWNRSFEDNQQGGWSQENGVISQKSPGVDQRLTFGDTNWSDYEYTLEAQKTGGAEGFLVLFRVQSDKDFSWVNLGGWQNKQHAIERRNAVNVKQNRQGVVSPMIDGSIETGKWYTIKVRCEGDNVKVSLDGKQILDVTDSYMAKTGCVGIGTWSTQAKFRNFKVTSLDGKTVLFNETPKVSQPLKIRHWEPFGGAKISINTTDAFNGRSCVQITQGGGVQHEGFIQKKIDGIQQGGFVLKKDETYLFSIGIKSNDVTMPRIECRFYDRQQNKIVTCSTSFIDNYVRGQWTKISGKFWDLSDDVSDGILMLTLDPGLTVNEGTYLIDQISIMPKSWAENGGFRPDLLKAIADLKPALIRWPGGCFASAYRWKDGIGPQEKRQPYPFSIWDDREVNSFGTDEYIAMCRRVGCEPHIVINAGTPSWNAKRTPETANVDWVQEACDWVEYCNGPATSKWGKVRAENGHPEPYNVKHWEIDNETQGNLTVDEYIATIKKFVPAMKKVDPTIKIAVAGSHYGPRGPWDNPIINQAGELIDYISFHQYDDPNKFADGPGKIETYFRELQKVIAQSPNK
ncbi:MAG: DUF1080 domain-containing protein, partial [Planctomycetaceae bacterium]|nr:DUF1080 domain-containing protein [Planctomycetaceae bacterium]